MAKGNRSNDPSPGPFFNESPDNFAVETPDGVHLTMMTRGMMGPIDLGPYRAGPGGPGMSTGARNGPAMIGNKSGKGKTVTVK